MRRRPALSSRQHLSRLAAALLAPILVLAAILAWQFARAEQRRFEQRAQTAAQQIVAIVDTELARLQAAAETLASSAALRHGNFERFHKRALDVIGAFPNPRNYAVVVRDLTGQQVVNTWLPWGVPLPKGAGTDADAIVLATRRPHVQDLFVGATAGRHLLTVRVAVMTDEVATHVLSIGFEPAHILNLLEAQRLPAGWVAMVLDRNLRVLARTKSTGQFVGVAVPGTDGDPASATGVINGLNLEGVPVLGAYAHSGLSTWRIFVEVPKSIVEAPLWRSMALLGVCALALLTITSFLAAWAAGRISRPMAQLERLAGALGRGEILSPVETGLAEANTVADAMARASSESRDREVALAASEGKLRATHESPAVGVAEVDGYGRFLSVNDAQCRLTGSCRSDLLGAHFAHSTHPDYQSEENDLFRRQVKGELEIFTVERPHLRNDGGTGWARVSSRAVRGLSGEFLYAIRVAEDISERKRAEEQQVLLVNELNHRVKNTLATIQSLALQTFQRGKLLEVAKQEFEGRLLALSRTHNLLNETRWESATLSDVLGAEIAPYVSADGSAVSVNGPAVALQPKTAVALGMLFHELATNASKYGSLSATDGTLRVTWLVVSEARGRTLRLDWLEAGPSPPLLSREGFGSKLIRRLVEGELGGTLNRDFTERGLHAVLTVPLQGAAGERDDNAASTGDAWQGGLASIKASESVHGIAV
jgi:PAS domain S-box-containing protein